MNVKIIGKANCKWCREARKLCKANKLDYKYLDLDKPGNRELVRWMDIENITTVPQIFVDGNLIGGYDAFKKFLEKETPYYVRATD